MLLLLNFFATLLTFSRIKILINLNVISHKNIIKKKRKYQNDRISIVFRHPNMDAFKKKFEEQKYCNKQSRSLF